MSEKLTLEWCFKYPKARIREYGLSYNTYLDEYDNLLCMLKIYDAELWEKTQNCKLILRPLSSLTDEEKEILAKVSNINLRELELLTFAVDSNALVINFSSDFTFAQFKSFVDWCRKNNFDVDKCEERKIAFYG